MQYEGRDLKRKTEHRQTTESREIERERDRQALTKTETKSNRVSRIAIQ